jgi:hypothetical protein
MSGLDGRSCNVNLAIWARVISCAFYIFYRKCNGTVFLKCFQLFESSRPLSFSDFQQTDLSKIDRIFFGILDLSLGLMEQRVVWVRLSSDDYFIDHIASIKCRLNKHSVISILS